MKNRKCWWLLPITVFPYAILFSLATLFLANRVELFTWIMVLFINDNIFFLFAVCVLFLGVLSGVLSIVYFVSALRKKWDALFLAKTAMVIKLVQVPAYILIYVLCAALFVSVLFPVSFLLLLLDCYTLYLTGTISVAAGINAGREGLINRKQCIWFIILQFIFCADVFATIFFYKKLLKAKTIDKDSV